MKASLTRAVLVCLLYPAVAPAQSETTQTNIQPIARVSDKRITECSGIAISRANKDAVWMHNDSGDKPRLYLVGLDGQTKLTLKVDRAKAVDWEDICSFTLDGRNWLLVGDIGDNLKNRSKKRPKCRLYLIEEPTLSLLPAAKRGRTSKREQSVKPTRSIEFEYDRGPCDCEGIAVDTTTREVLLLSKRLNPLRCHLYSLPLEPKKKKVRAKTVARVPMPICTGLDLSPDGRRLLMTSPRIGFVLERRQGQSWAEAARRAPTALPPLPRSLHQTEAICWDHSARSVLVTSEGRNQQIWKLNPVAALSGPARKKSPLR